MIEAIFTLISRLPFKVLYALSDFVYVLVYHVVRYRRSLVRKHLATAFPEKTDKERHEIEHKFYHWLCDYFVETIKLLTITPEEMKKHLEWRGFEQVEDCYDSGQSCAAMLGHYCNWEWLSATPVFQQRHPDAAAVLIYHPLRSKPMDELFKKLRSQLGGVCVRKQDILRALVGYRRENRMNLAGYIADQTPKLGNIHLWLPFLNHDTPVFTGAERIIKKMQNAVFYVDMERPCRGKYIVTFKRIDVENLPVEDEYPITHEFFRLLEKSIQRQPEFYLWTHNRWKHKRPTS